MSITVNQIVLHQLVKQAAEDGNVQLNTVLRNDLLQISAEVEQLMLELHQAYQGKAKGYGVFKEESLFARQLNRLLEQETDFLPFSYEAAKLLATELGKYTFAESGTLVLCQYNFLATDYLFIALLDSRISMLVDENLEIQRTQYLNINQFDIAARINLTDLRLNAQSNRYLTFIKGRVGRKVGDFFMDFLGADEGLNPQVQNQCLLQAVSDYCEQGELNKAQTQAVKKQVFDYCKGQINSGDEIALAELSEELPTLNERSFAAFAHERDYGLEESIPPLRSTLKSLTKFSGSGKGVTISFDAELINQRIIWDEAADSLTIHGLPANLRDQLRRNLTHEN
ncbi:nucleoid-associated protein [Actinobacillus succinogenes]|uniref:Nucleoid-associated protein Asuc_0779 n=1 Tax=Actinobacillus succinogenes (strain ATCC 55618 / DSM 22257 / CCUG 43843 / 130Z) TaxID=339671 RepID=NDPA_ACTSZ|nr:nucleoid-associated protein YejK [Actinobacillus succinogenes]A6VMF2.1 RecName: Full=Nucleoid-associated protein Asuc_0779 [Actinobacillus succinogenes 130Z]ABR74149.1 37kDa nucleoid-associated protein [Actinobacillus succinogenes 130Z]PHI39420.1 nucleoid-associated protein [Actinobacillus succinogenes]